jgi:hypothetical protein
MKSILSYFQKLFGDFNKPQTYGSALEEYIVSHSPQTSCDVDRLTRQFEIQHSRKGW